MRIAIPNEKGEICMHFGHTPEFALYEVEDKKIKASTLVLNDAHGHEDIAMLLNDLGVNVVLAGGLGEPMAKLFEEMNIEFYSGIQGPTEGAIEAYLAGDLEEVRHYVHGCGCHHHHEEGEEHHCCGEHGEGEEHHCCQGHHHE